MGKRALWRNISRQRRACIVYWGTFPSTDAANPQNVQCVLAHVGICGIVGHCQTIEEGHGAFNVVVDCSSAAGARIIELVALIVELLAVLPFGKALVEQGKLFKNNVSLTPDQRHEEV